jgi:hypothetical protein
LAFYYTHLATALLQARGRETDALSALLRAETLAPQLVRVMSEAHDAVGTLLLRARSGCRQDLRGLADRVGWVG